MRIQTLRISNFMPYKGNHEIAFPDHETQNVMLIFGDNMRGKTSILNAIRWGFYGVALGRHLRQIPKLNLVNRDAASDGDWEVTVAMTFNHGGKEYELTRSINKRKNTTHPRHDADFEELIGLRIDGVPVPGDAISYEISQIMPQEVSRFFLFDGELLQEYENLLIDESDQGRMIKERIESVLGVPALIHARDELKLLLKDARAAQRKEAQKKDDLRKFAQDQRNLELKLEDIESNLRDLEDQKVGLEEKIDDIDDFLKGTEAVQSRKVELSRLEAQQVDAEKEIERLIEGNRLLMRTAWQDVLANSVRPTIKSLQDKRKQMSDDLQNAISLQNRIDDLKRSIEESERCAMCGQELPKEVTDRLRAELDDLLAKGTDGELDIRSLSAVTTTIESLEAIRGQGEVGRIVDNVKAIAAAKV
jgi:DNA sulfur modification protein DndD